ncbi:MAG TPA: hemolysin III family protein [Magnetospirillum sp.]|nr:hemolysin III family protein [Magnetospirillum sp.]
MYTPEEERADALVHTVGVGLATAGAGWLFSRLLDRSFAEATVLGFYAVALVGTLGISAAYNLAKGPIKDRLRRVDHAMIFVMIAATYAPFVVLRLPDGIAIPLGVAVGGGCVAGALIKLLFPRRFDRLSVALYLGMGWAIAWALGPLRAGIGDLPFTLLVAGGCLYTLGVPFCLMERLRFHNALWHACVLAGAAAHFATMAVEFG